MLTSSEQFGADPLLGAFARIYRRGSAAELAKAFVADDLTQVQLTLAVLGLSTIPDGDELAGIDLAELRAAFTSRGRVIWGVSATYNTAHPDDVIRAAETANAASFIAGLRPLAPVAATLCTGTRDPDNMWRANPGNSSSAAWADLRRSLDVLLPAAAHAEVLLAVEPEPGNVIAGTSQARRLVRELGADAERIGFILDPANLVTGAPFDEHEHILTEAFHTLGERTICVHAKDIHSWSDTLLGLPGIDYHLVSRLWAALPNAVPLIIQDTTEDELPRVRDWLLERRVTHPRAAAGAGACTASRAEVLPPGIGSA